MLMQDAILFTRINAEMIVENLNDYPTKEELLEDYDEMLKTHYVLVLCRDNHNGFSSVSYVVTRDMFEANQPGITLSTEKFTHVRSF